MRKKILINTNGYMTEAKKSAVCLTSADDFYLINADDGKSVFSHTLSTPFYDKYSDDVVKIADFSEFKTPGKYYIRIGLRHSNTFEISDDVCASVGHTLLTAIHMSRCGYDLFDSEIDSPFVHAPCHTELVPLYYSERQLDVSGGWHSCGGYEKHVSVTAMTCAFLLYSHILFGTDSEDVLDECRWGLEWLLKMQEKDGSVHYKVDMLQDVNDYYEPASDRNEYFVFPPSCDAVLSFTAVMALASRVYADIDRTFSRKLSRAATDGWLWIINTPSYEATSFPIGAKPTCTADYIKTNYKGTYLWMLTELYNLTGDSIFHDKIRSFVYESEFMEFTLKNNGGFSVISYLLSNEPKDDNIAFYMRKKTADRADNICSLLRSSGYFNALGAKFDEDLSSTNLDVLSDCLICQLAHAFFGLPRYSDSAEDIFSYINGCNPLEISFISGSENGPSRMHHRMSMAKGKQMYGLIVNGPNLIRADEFSKWRISKDTPPAKCYIDNEFSISTNEPVICYSAAALMVSSYFSNKGSDTLRNANF